jgi:hypothetical protein
MLRSALLALGIAAALAGPAAADPPGAPLSTWIPDGEVKAVAVSGKIAYLGGNFGRIAPYTGGSARLDASSAAAKAPWPQVAGTVNAVQSDQSGGWYLGGSFSSVGGVPRQNVAHVRADGTLDENWNASTNGVVRAIAVRQAGIFGSNVFVGGSFTSADGTARDNLAAFDPGSGALQNIDIGVTNATERFCTGPTTTDGIYTLVAVGSQTAPVLYVGGIFDTAHAGAAQATRNGLAAFSLPVAGAPTITAFDGNMLVPGSTPRLQPVWSMALDASNHVYVGGCVASVNNNTQTRNGVARLNATSGAADASWIPSGCCGTQVDTIALTANRLYVAGFLDNFRDVMALNLVDGAVDASWEPPLHDQTGRVTALFANASTLYAGGNFKTDSTAPARKNLAAIDATTGALTGWAPDGAGSVKALAAAGSDVVAGGSFETYGGVPRRDLAAIDLTTGMPTAFQAPIDEQSAGFTSVDELALGDGVLWAAGNFGTTGSNPTTSGLAAFDSQSGAQTSFNLPVGSGSGHVHALAATGSIAYIGGSFSQIGSTQRRGIAAVRHVPGQQGEVLRFDADVTGDVDALALDGGTLYAGGLFDKVNTTGVGATRNNLASVDSTSGDVLPFDPNVDGRVRALQLDGGTLFAGGDFHSIGSTERQRLAAIDRGTAAPTAWRADADQGVFALALHGRTLFTGGLFGTIGGAARPGIAAVDADTAAVAGWPTFTLVANPLSGGKFPGPEPTVPVTSALATGGSTGLLAGGDFRLSSPGLNEIHLAAFRLPPLAPTGAAATAGDAQATVSFTPPPGDGGSPVTSYTVTASPGGHTTSGAGSPLVVTGLQNDTAYTFTVTASNAVGAGPPSAPSNAVTPHGPGGGGPGADTKKPVLLSFSATRKRFRVGPRRTPSSGTATAAAAAKRKRAKRGTTLKLKLSEAAKVRFAVSLKTSGRKVGKACRKPTRKNRRRKRCTRLVAKGSFTRSARKGRSKVTFSGRIGKRALKRGRYVMRATPTDAAGNRGLRRSLSFTIVR